MVENKIINMDAKAQDMIILKERLSRNLKPIPRLSFKIISNSPFSENKLRLCRVSLQLFT